MDKSIIRCPSCWEGMSRDTEQCPRCGARIAKAERERKPLGFAFWRNVALVVVSVILIIAAFIPMFRIEVGEELTKSLVLTDMPDGYRVKFETEETVKFNVSAVEMISYFRDSLRNLDDEELAKTKYSQRMEMKTARFATAVTEDMQLTVVVLKDNHIHLLNEMMSDYMHIALLSGAEPMEFSTGIAGVMSIIYILLLVAFLTLAIVNLVLHLCGRATPYGALVVLLCFVAPFIGAYGAIMYACMGFNAMAAGIWISAITAILAVVGVSIVGILSRRAHSWTGILTRCGSLVLAAVMIAVVFMPMITLNVNSKFSNFTTKTSASVNLTGSYYSSLDVSCGEYEDLRDQYADAYESLETMKKSDFEDGDASLMQVQILSALAALCVDQAVYTSNFSYTLYLVAFMCIFAALVIWQSLTYLATGRNHRKMSFAFRVTAAVLMVLILVCNILIVCLGNAGANESTFVGTENKVLGDFVLLGLSFASIVGAVCGIGMIFIPHKNFKKWVWGAYVLVEPQETPAPDTASTETVADVKAETETEPVPAAAENV